MSNMITLRQVSKYYKHNQAAEPIAALEDINLMVAAGEIFGLLGESGAGKSTLLRCINLLERPSTGQVLIEDVDLTTLPANALKQQRQQIGMIFQHFNLLDSRTVFANVALPLELMQHSTTQIHRRVKELLHLVGLDSHSQHYPLQLSGGQKQRVAIARALATKPKILLCDEATSALDPPSTTTILNLLKEINCNLKVTIVLITHELEVIKRICDRAGILEKGQLIEQATVLKLFTHPKMPATQQLIQKGLHLLLPPLIQAQLQTEPAADKSPIIRMVFMGKDSNQPIITLLAKQFDISISILQADIETIQDAIVGFTICQWQGTPEAITQALAYTQSLSIQVEILGYV